MRPLLSWLLSGYDRRSLVALALTGAVCLVVAFVWRDLIDWSQGVDWLLVGIWGVMALLLVGHVDGRHDLPLLAVGFAGGALIEWWGTESVLWIYYTHERPPLWILPAWPVSALAIDRLARILERAAPWLARATIAYWVAVPGFALVMTQFLWIRIHVPASQVVVGLMAVVALVGARPRRDLLRFVAGCALGWFLEYWGTSRHCWIYYTFETPPPQAVLAHGFATVAFARGVQGCAWAWRRIAGGRAQRASSDVGSAAPAPAGRRPPPAPSTAKAADQPLWGWGSCYLRGTPGASPCRPPSRPSSTSSWSSGPPLANSG